MISQRKLIEEFEHGAKEGIASNMFIEDNILYSYGHHFPLLVRFNWGIIQNADKYSVTTSCHQSKTSRIADILIPFSALEMALGAESSAEYSDLIDKLEKIELIDKSKARYDVIAYMHKTTNQRIRISEFNSLSNELKACYIPVEERRPEALVFTFEGRYFLSSMDRYLYFISELPEPVSSVEEAYEILKPKELNPAKEYKRQGEWFFQLFEVEDPKKIYQSLSSSFELPRKDRRSNAHIATRGGYYDGKLVVSGQIRHSEHGTLWLSTTKDIKIFVAYHNRAVQSWSARGRVD